MSLNLILSAEIVRFTIAMFFFACAVALLFWYLEQCLAVWAKPEKVERGVLVL